MVEDTNWEWGREWRPATLGPRGVGAQRQGEKEQLAGDGGGEGVGGAVQERAEMVRGVSPWGRLGS